jgi:hypothetical protein
VFLALEDTTIKYQFMVKVLIDYIRSLSHFGMVVEHFLYELVINLLVRHNRCVCLFLLIVVVSAVVSVWCWDTRFGGRVLCVWVLGGRVGLHT